MSLPSSVLRAMLAVGASAETVVAAVEAAQADAEARLAARRAKANEKKRWQRAQNALDASRVPGDTEGHKGTSGDIEGTDGDNEGTCASPQRSPTPPKTTPLKVTPSDPKGSSAPKGAGRQRGSRIPDGFEVSDEARVIAAEMGFTGRAADEPLAEFGDFWRGVPGLKGTKLDWPATLRNRLREVRRREAMARSRASPINGHRKSGNGRVDAFLAELDPGGDPDDPGPFDSTPHRFLGSGARH